MSGVVGLGGQPLELLGELEQFRFDFGADHETDECPDLAPLFAIVVRPRFRIRHYRLRRLSAPSTVAGSKATNSGNLVTGSAGRWRIANASVRAAGQ
jgi:hypothetical protein